MKSVTSQSKYVLIALWLILICASLSWNIYQVGMSHDDVYLQTARSMFELVVTTRQWNANMGGVYVPVSDVVRSNPYLEAPDRDLIASDGRALTKINPAFMTRMISELAVERKLTQFHITSLKPIRPENAPTDWEIAALTLFEQQTVSEYSRVDEENNQFFYMAPLVTEPSCLPCHAKQGYRVGDVRGGISLLLKTQDENILPLLVSHLSIGLIGAILIFIFSTRLARIFELLEKQSIQDFLTRIANRSYFDTAFQREFRNARRYRQPLSILMCDVDHFKSFNDQYGHQAGDIALIEIAQVLSRGLKRTGDLVARYGGEEFVILLPQTPPEGAAQMAEALRKSVEEVVITFKGASAGHRVTISIGVWTYTGDNIHPDEVLEKADQAMYTAKRLGRNQVCIYKETPESRQPSDKAMTPP